MRCKLQRQLYANGPWSAIIATYGEREQFENALAGMLSPLRDLISYDRSLSALGRNVNREIIVIVKRMADGSISRERYKLEDMPTTPGIDPHTFGQSDATL